MSKPSIGVRRSRYSMASMDTFGSEITDPANKVGRMVRRLIILAPSLLHETAPYLLAVDAVKMGLKITERVPLVILVAFLVGRGR